MACYPFPYVPQPPRAWSRVQHPCTFSSANEEDVGLTGLMLSKGNVLQYKANSARLAAWQRYSLQAQGKWTNRNTTWATQQYSRPNASYTNPNTQWLRRVSATLVNVNAVNGAVEGLSSATETTACAQAAAEETQPPGPASVLPPSPSESGGGGSPPPPPFVPPPPPPPSGGGTTAPVDMLPASGGQEPPLVPPPIVIEDGGQLICNVQEHPCTGQVLSQQPAEQAFNLTTDSDVPGPIQPLYWNDGTPTWFPRQNLTMNNSGTKWPYTTRGPPTFVAAVRPPFTA